jgi:multidrug efflux system membrane fusion protein
MKRALLWLVLIGGVGAFIWHAYQVGWLVSPLAQKPTKQTAWSGHPHASDQPTATAAAAAAPDAQATDDGSQGRRRWQRSGQNSAGPGARGNDGPIPVLTATASYEDVPVSIDAVGTIQALNSVTVRTQVDGQLLDLDFSDGQDVKHNDVLAHIDPSTYQAQYDQAVAKKAQDEVLLANAKVDLERYTKLAATEYGSRQQADTQKALVAQYEAQLKIDQGVINSAKVTLDRTVISAPIDGRTGIRLVDAGNILHAADATGIVVIAQLQPIAMVFNLPQQYLTAANAASAMGSVEVQALDADNVTVLDTGRVEVIDNQVDQTTGTVKIKADFPNAARRLWPGQFVNVRLFVGTVPHATVVPTAAVQRGPNGAYVYVVNDDSTVKLTNVTVGRQDEAKSVIETGIEPPARVVTTGFARLTDGAHVSLDTASNTPAGAAPRAPAAPGAQAAPTTPSAPSSDDGAKGPAGAEKSVDPNHEHHRRHNRQQQSEATPAETTQ